MDIRLLCLFTVALLLGFSSAQQEFTAAQCEISPKARINCGPPGISSSDCNKKGCCFDSSISGVIWCFYPKPEDDCLF